MTTPADWRIEFLGDLARVYSGGTPSRSTAGYWGGSVPWVTTAEIDQRRIRSSRATITESGLAASAARIAPAGTLLLAMYGQGKTRGKVAILEIAASMNQACAAIEVGPCLDSRYLAHYLDSRYLAIRAMSNAGSQDNLSGDLVKGIEVIVPPIGEQQAIAAVLDDADQVITMLERLIAKKRDIKQGMMQELLTGRTRLGGFEGAWRTVALGQLGTFLRGRGVKRDEVRASGVPCIRYGELYTTYSDYTASTVSFVEPSVASAALPITNGDVLFAGSGETKEEIGISVAYIGDESAVAGGDIIVLRGTAYHPVYLAALLNTREVANQKTRAGQGDAVVHINWRALAAIEVRVPSFAEQQAIAKVLVDADSEVQALEGRTRTARAVKTGMMQALLTGRTRLPVEAAS